MVADNVSTINPPVVPQANGKYAQQLGDKWFAEYFEDPQTGLWRAEIYHRDVPEWLSVDHTSVQEAARAAREYFDQL